MSAAITSFLLSNAPLFAQADSSESDFPAPLGWFLAVASFGFFVAVSVIAWQGFATWRARMSVAREEAYKELAHNSSLAMDRIVARLDEQSTLLSQLQARTAEIERVLKDVE